MAALRVVVQQNQEQGMMLLEAKMVIGVFLVAAAGRKAVIWLARRPTSSTPPSVVV